MSSGLPVLYRTGTTLTTQLVACQLLSDTFVTISLWKVGDGVDTYDLFLQGQDVVDTGYTTGECMLSNCFKRPCNLHYDYIIAFFDNFLHLI